MNGTEIVCRGDRQYAITHEHLRDVIPQADPELGNPRLWWVERLTPPRDWVFAGAKTKRECYQAINEDCNHG